MSYQRTSTREATEAETSQQADTDGLVNTSETAEVCPECSGSLIQTESRGEMHCEGCGLVVQEDQIDYGPEWRNFDDSGGSRSRVGAPETKTRHDGLSTKISWEDRDAHGNTITGRKRQKMKRLRTWHERSKRSNSKDRNQSQALDEIERMASALGAPDSTHEMAAVVFRRAHKQNLLPGRSLEGVATAALYAAFRKDNIPRSLSEVESVSRVGERRIQRTYRYISRELSLSLKPVDPTRYIPRFTSQLSASENVVRRAEAFGNELSGTTFSSGKDPTVVAATAIYVASLYEGERFVQGEVTEACDIAPVSLRNNYQHALEFLDIIPIENLDRDKFAGARSIEKFFQAHRSDDDDAGEADTTIAEATAGNRSTSPEFPSEKTN